MDWFFFLNMLPPCTLRRNSFSSKYIGRTKNPHRTEHDVLFIVILEPMLTFCFPSSVSSVPEVSRNLFHTRSGETRRQRKHTVYGKTKAKHNPFALFHGVDKTTIEVEFFNFSFVHSFFCMPPSQLCVRFIGTLARILWSRRKYRESFTWKKKF